MIEFEKPRTQDIDLIRKLTENHFSYTSSRMAQHLLNNWKKSQKISLR